MFSAKAQQAPKISGAVNLRYQYNEAADAHGFDLRRARLDVRGDLAPQIGYRLHVEFAGGAKILDAYMQWRPDESIGLQAGQFKIPFSLENPYSPQTLETVDNSLVITSLAGYTDVSGVSANGRDIGLGASGGFLHRDGFSIVNWSVGVFNGSGINTGDRNRHKDAVGTLSVQPARALTFAASHYNGWATDAEGGNIRRLRWGGGAKYDDGRWLARTEYIRGRTADDLHSEGAYGVVGYFVHPQVQTVIKYDWFTRDTNDSDTRLIYYTAGLNYTPVKNVKVQLNYSYRTTPVDNFHYAALQLWGLF